MFGSPFDTPFIVPVVAIICWAIVSVTRAKHGIGHRWQRNSHDTPVPPMFEKMLGKAMEERDAEIRGLRERVEVLEKIVTDSHGRVSLADEIEKLKDRK